MNKKEEKSNMYVQNKMFPYIVNAVGMEEKSLFTINDLKKAYENGYDNGYSDGKQESLLEHLKKNKDEEAKLIAERKQQEIWNEVQRYFQQIDNSIFKHK